MTGDRPLRVAIIGAGPSGSALAIFLARHGADVTLFDDGRRPDLVVGESLVPALVPILQRLGLEAETAGFSCVKPGVSFVWSPTDRYHFTFARFAPAVFPYAYNIPRPRFDEVLLRHAIRAGATHVAARARVERARNGTGAELALAADTVAVAPSLGGRQPDLIVDASGRARLVARALRIGAAIGPRRDVAHFAHFDGYRWDEPAGQVVITRGQQGWSWCIPLPDRLSVGIVLDQEAAARLGRAPEERLAQAIAEDPWLRDTVHGGRRVTAVATYSNYQLISMRGIGPGWAMVGDAFGFVDPMLSPGVFLALHSAELLAAALDPVLAGRMRPAPEALASMLGRYAQRQRAILAAWFELVAYLYDGRMLAVMRAGRSWMDGGTSGLKLAAQNHIERHIALQASGMLTGARYSAALLRVLSRYGLRGVDPAELAIR